MFFVPAGEVREYLSAGIECVGVPNDVRGITATRNWILKNTEERHVVMLDDDMKFISWMKMHENNFEQIKMSAKEFAKECQTMFELTEGMSYRIWGPATQSAIRAVYPYKPILFRSYVLGTCIGIVNDGITFDESFKVKEDYELCLRCVKEDGGVVAARYWIAEASHWKDEGGCRDYRTVTMEEDAVSKLMAMYPGMVRTARRKSGINIEIL
jgi:hypothetical protein